jgi:hypothetical protein
MDTLTFNTPILYRHLTFSEAKKEPIAEINLEKVLEGLEMNMETASCTLYLTIIAFRISMPLMPYIEHFRKFDHKN